MTALFIDTEGHDCEIVKATNFTELRPEVVIFERKNCGLSRRATAVQVKAAVAHLRTADRYRCSVMQQDAENMICFLH